MVETGQLIAGGQIRATRYILSSAYQLLGLIDMAIYFEKESDERKIQEDFNFQLITDTLRDVDLFTADEANHLQQLKDPDAGQRVADFKLRIKSGKKSLFTFMYNEKPLLVNFEMKIYFNYSLLTSYILA